MVSDQSAQQGIGVLGVAQVPGADELVQAGGLEAGGVADFVQPGGGLQQIGVRAENGRKAACPGGDALVVRPAAGKGPPAKAYGRAVAPMVPACPCGPGEIAAAGRSRAWQTVWKTSFPRQRPIWPQWAMSAISTTTTSRGRGSCPTRPSAHAIAQHQPLPVRSTRNRRRSV